MTRFSPAVDANTTEIAELTWELPSDVQVHPGETFFYSGGPVNVARARLQEGDVDAAIPVDNWHIGAICELLEGDPGAL